MMVPLHNKEVPHWNNSNLIQLVSTLATTNSYGVSARLLALVAAFSDTRQNIRMIMYETFHLYWQQKNLLWLRSWWNIMSCSLAMLVTLVDTNIDDVIMCKCLDKSKPCGETIISPCFVCLASSGGWDNCETAG